MTETESKLDIIGYTLMMGKALDDLRLNEYRIAMLIAEHLNQKPEQEQKQELIKLEIPMDDIIKIVEIHQQTSSVDVFELAWWEVLELNKKAYPCMTLNNEICLRWLEIPRLNRKTKTVNLMVHEDMVQVYKALRTETCLPYAFVLSRNATKLLQKIKEEAQYSKKWCCPTCLVKSSLFKQKSPNWKVEALEPAMQEIMSYTAYELKQFEPTARTVMLGCKLDEDTIEGKIKALEKEKQLYDCLPADLLNQHFPYHEQNMKMLEALKQM